MKASPPSILFFIIASIASAADWPTFRGGDRRDISTETGLLKQWPEGGPNKVWTSDQGGLGYSGFSVVDGTLFTMGSRDIPHPTPSPMHAVGHFDPASTKAIF